MRPQPRTHRLPLRGALALGLLAGLALLSLAACSSTQPASTQVDDTVIATKIESKLISDPEINPFKIDVDVDEGVVRLSGAVENEEVRAEAERMARDTDGVQDVQNDIEIGERSFEERLSDGAVAAKIKTKLVADPQVNPFNINVDVDNGVATLTGRVKTETARAEAEKLARDTEGVREVRNQIRVGDLAE